MAKATVYNLKSEKVGQVDLSDEIFATEVNQDLLYEVVKAQLAARRAGTAKVKVRSEVAGSTKKIYKQKGTGRARHGSIRAPIFVGGGQVHGPVPRSYAYAVNKKVRRGALCSALSLRQREGQLFVIDELKFGEIKTKTAAAVLKAFKVAEGKGALFVDLKDNDKLAKSTRNLAKSQTLPPEGLNVYDIMRHPALIISKQAVSKIEERLKEAAE